MVPILGGHHIIAELSVNTQESFSQELLDSNTSLVSASPESETTGVYQQYLAPRWTQGFWRLSLHWLPFRAFPGRPSGFRHQNKQIKTCSGLGQFGQVQSLSLPPCFVILPGLMWVFSDF